MDFKKIKIKFGFTLVETVVALAVFSVATTYAVSVFVQSNTVQKRTANVQRVLADARYALEVMAREVRLGSLDYDYYLTQDIDLNNMPLTQNNAILAVRDADNSQILFRRAQSAQAGRYVIQVYASGQWLDITPEDLSVVRLSFYIFPAQDPFSWNDQLNGYQTDEQPRVTIILESKSLHPDLAEAKATSLQTTVTTRKYVR